MVFSYSKCWNTSEAASSLSGSAGPEHLSLHLFLPLVRNPSLGNAGSVSGHDSGLVCNPDEVSSVCIDGCVVGSMSQARVCKLSPEKSTLC